MQDELEEEMEDYESSFEKLMEQYEEEMKKWKEWSKAVVSIFADYSTCRFFSIKEFKTANHIFFISIDFKCIFYAYYQRKEKKILA